MIYSMNNHRPFRSYTPMQGNSNNTPSSLNNTSNASGARIRRPWGGLAGQPGGGYGGSGSGSTGLVSGNVTTTGGSISQTGSVQSATPSQQQLREIRTRALFSPFTLTGPERDLMNRHHGPHFDPRDITYRVRQAVAATPGLAERIANVSPNEVSQLRQTALTNPANLDSGELTILEVEKARLGRVLRENPSNLDSGELAFIQLHNIQARPQGPPPPSGD